MSFDPFVSEIQNVIKDEQGVTVQDKGGWISGITSFCKAKWIQITSRGNVEEVANKTMSLINSNKEDIVLPAHVLRWLSDDEISHIASKVMDQKDVKGASMIKNALVFAQAEHTKKTLENSLISSYDQIQKEALIKSIGEKISYPHTKKNVKIKTSEEKEHKAVKLRELCIELNIPKNLAEGLLEGGEVGTAQHELQSIFLMGYSLNKTHVEIPYDHL